MDRSAGEHTLVEQRPPQSDGQQIAIPYDFGPLVVFYNKDLFAKAGLKEPSTTWTTDEFEADARKIGRAHV